MKEDVNIRIQLCNILLFTKIKIKLIKKKKF